MRSASVKSRAARSGSVAASALAMPLSADAFEDSSVMELAMRSARSGSVAASASRDAAQRRCLRGLVGDGVGDAFGVGEEPGGAGGIVSGRPSVR